MTAYTNAVFMRACARIEWKWIVFYFFPPLCFRLSAFFTLRSKEMSDQLCYLKKLRLKLFIIVDEQFKYLNLKEPTIFGKWWWNGWARTTILRPVFWTCLFFFSFTRSSHTCAHFSHNEVKNTRFPRLYLHENSSFWWSNFHILFRHNLYWRACQRLCLRACISILLIVRWSCMLGLYALTAFLEQTAQGDG